MKIESHIRLSAILIAISAMGVVASFVFFDMYGAEWLISLCIMSVSLGLSFAYYYDYDSKLWFGKKENTA